LSQSRAVSLDFAQDIFAVVENNLEAVSVLEVKLLPNFRRDSYAAPSADSLRIDRHSEFLQRKASRFEWRLTCWKSIFGHGHSHFVPGDYGASSRRRERVRRYTASGFGKVTAEELVLEGTAIRVGIAEVFSVLDEDGEEL